MELNHDACYRAIQARDPRFDGRFFTAVRTTRIYCRPICPAPTPKRENCLFFPSAAAAQEAGFRPCLRCRPELAPELFTALGPVGVAAHALRLISDGALDGGSVVTLARRLGVTERHLRRVCADHLGASPLMLAQTRRVLFARQLMNETSLSLTEVALGAGFGSVRQFNAVMRALYQRPPSELRRQRVEAPQGGERTAITLKLAFSPPYDWGALMRFLGPRAIPGVEQACPDLYRRTIVLDGAHGVVAVRPALEGNYLLATIWFPQVSALAQIAGRLRRLFDLGADMDAITTQLQEAPYLGRYVRALPGVRVPGAWDPFELAVRAILGQQVSVAAATTLAGRLVEAFGEPLDAPDAEALAPDLRRVFPTPERLAHADLAGLGVPRARAASITALAAAVAREPQLFENFRDLDDAVRRLCLLPGVGVWTAHYTAMRALREPDAFPATDLGLLRVMGLLTQPMNAGRLTEIAEAWRPWRAYAAMVLWQSESSPGMKEATDEHLAG